MSKLTRSFHLVLESLADDVVLVVFGILMLILVVCGVVMKDVLDMIAGSMFFGAVVGIIGNDAIERIVNDEDDGDILDYVGGPPDRGVKGRVPTKEEFERSEPQWCWTCGNENCKLAKMDTLMVCDFFERRSKEDMESDPHFGGHGDD